MLTVIGLQEDHLEQLCSDARKDSSEEVCIANFIFPQGFVISGTIKAVECVRVRAHDAGATTKSVAVSGAFHSPLMKPAVQDICSVLDELDIALPKIPVYSSLTGRPYTSTDEIRQSLAQQVTRPVLWEKVVQEMIKDIAGVQFVELGPGKQLKAMLRRIDRNAYKQCLTVMV